ncbi:hypothetical protein GGTG_08068 [Gaeumannomyces tritici R3-111a-1]|uniref:Uncharacterized protein n=1 Tax=Gaeumannomyces tritici (strain R3-111a-1) TaxID=644352 RepID=J3P3I2_GAET3|nr:hypothetical protein GGTG_08068 [Gaeumannomyces tritici R3-111a-1]EJT74224.1 hypothetical protein GGTG_08068 [Gaeumannomyces tritici R3-111a-1]
MSNGPIPSTLVLLPALHKEPAGAKVRFLGCVESYATGDATLTLEHDKAAAHGPRVRALIDVNLLLQSLKAEQTRAGEWVNVIGYIAPEPDQPRAPGPLPGEHHRVHVQAIVLWSAGSLNIQEYTSTVAARSNDVRAT